MKHVILLSSSYLKKTRIGIHFVTDSKDGLDKVREEIKVLTTNEVEIPFSTHSIDTDSDTWESVWQKDAFFEDVKLYDSIDEFKAEIVENMSLDGMSVAKYILTKVPCTHLKLQKLVYLCYEEYLVQFKKKLFEDKIFAFKYGPVVETVYKQCKGQSKLVFEEEIDDSESLNKTKSELSVKSRIMFAEDGVNKLDIIDKTVEKYGRHTAFQLVEHTHTKGSAWDISKKGLFEEITDETILSSRCV